MTGAGARAGAGPAASRNQQKKVFSWFFFALSLSLLRTTKAPLAPASWGCESASAPISSGAVVPGRRDNEARTWAKEAMAELLREAGDEGG